MDLQAPEHGKRCRLCGETKPLTAFYKAAGCVDGRRGECAACFQALAVRRKQERPELRRTAVERTTRWRRDNAEHYETYRRAYQQTDVYKRSLRNSHLKAKYGMTVDGYAVMLEVQGGRCAICRRLPREGQALRVDHDHRTGRVRGLLCFTCNAALGQLHDAPELVRRAEVYLRSHHRPDRTDRRIRHRLAALVTDVRLGEALRSGDRPDLAGRADSVSADGPPDVLPTG